MAGQPLALRASKRLVYDFFFTGNRVDGQAFGITGWESHGYQRTPDGWRIAQLHYSVPPPSEQGDVA